MAVPVGPRIGPVSVAAERLPPSARRPRPPSEKVSISLRPAVQEPVEQPQPKSRQATKPSTVTISGRAVRAAAWGVALRPAPAAVVRPAGGRPVGLPTVVEHQTPSSPVLVSPRRSVEVVSALYAAIMAPGRTAPDARRDAVAPLAPGVAVRLSRAVETSPRVNVPYALTNGRAHQPPLSTGSVVRTDVAAATTLSAVRCNSAR